jgi:hypothetical protein
MSGFSRPKSAAQSAGQGSVITSSFGNAIVAIQHPK